MPVLSVQPIQTEIFQPRQDLLQFVKSSVPRTLVQERMILVITSKIVSLAENRLVAKDSISKKELVQQEADVFLGEVAYGCYLTVKHGLFIPSAGIDESNSATGDYILFPKDPYQSAENLWSALKKEWNLKELGILITDSHTTPLRKGVTGIGLAYWGFQGLRNLVGTEDLFGRQLVMTNMNLVDGLSVAAVMMMGEGNECQPLAVIHGASVVFSEKTNRDEIAMPLQEDLYAPFFKQATTKSSS